MNILVKYVIALMLTCTVTGNYAQVTPNSEKMAQLESQKIVVENEEKAQLKQAVEAINKRLDAGEISEDAAAKLKLLVAEKHALNIKNRLAIIDNQLALLARNTDSSGVLETNNDGFTIVIGKTEESDEFDLGTIYIGSKIKKKPVVYDKRTTSDLVFAIGFNNAIIEGQSLNDSPYKIGGSGFVELGWAWKTRVLENSNAIRFKYGVSVQWNKLDIKNNLYFTQEEARVSLEEFPLNLRKSKFRSTNLVVPVHFEFGPSKKIERENYFRYSTYRKFKIGVGAYGGLVLQSLQKLKYDENGSSQKDKFKDYNTNNFVYGLSTYVAWGNVGLYAKYDLSTIFKNQAVSQNNISLGLRFDMD
ncbi:hypothetical protein ACFSQP_09035 [Bizionia sediminis]|uniref:PorT family protein n=1 Tax=Bizionia sediminis TaxID=1737064 RepID=A0ABW5KTN0_9FLAO